MEGSEGRNESKEGERLKGRGDRERKEKRGGDRRQKDIVREGRKRERKGERQRERER